MVLSWIKVKCCHYWVFMGLMDLEDYWGNHLDRFGQMFGQEFWKDIWTDFWTDFWILINFRLVDCFQFVIVSSANVAKLEDIEVSITIRYRDNTLELVYLWWGRSISNRIAKLWQARYITTCTISDFPLQKNNFQ